MKRFHVHIAVDSIDNSVNFYSKLFGQAPSVQHGDYAKWMLDDPRVNFAISTRSQTTGLDHLGFQLDSKEELDDMTAQLQKADLAVFGQGAATCCYAQSDKGWVHDPQGIAWESFVTTGSSTTYGTDTAANNQIESACCAPQAVAVDAVASTSKPRVKLGQIAVATSCGTSPSTGSSCC